MENRNTPQKNTKANKTPFKPPFKKRAGGFRKSFKRRPERPKDEFEQKVVDLARVTRVMAGGKRMKFRACMVVGDKKGRVGIGVAKGADVAMAISKSVTKAKKQVISVPIIDGTVPHEINIKKSAAKIMIRPGRKGSGIKAGGVLRIVLELAGIKDVVAKILGTNNKVNNAKAAILALTSFVPQASIVESKKVEKNNIDKPKDIKQDKSKNV
ncbi:30S ribosomal protein S5 [bacterium]|nr:30S ribosomal protein S5 [bacterium]